MNSSKIEIICEFDSIVGNTSHFFIIVHKQQSEEIQVRPICL